MLNPEQEAQVRLEVTRLLAGAGVSAEKIIDVATPLSEWILGRSHSQPSSIDDKA
jgi:hypothetical protein